MLNKNFFRASVAFLKKMNFKVVHAFKICRYLNKSHWMHFLEQNLLKCPSIKSGFQFTPLSHRQKLLTLMKFEKHRPILTREIGHWNTLKQSVPWFIWVAGAKTVSIIKELKLHLSQETAKYYLPICATLFTLWMVYTDRRLEHIDIWSH